MLKRQILSSILSSMKLFPIVMLLGSRQIGKSTILQELKAKGIIQEIFSLDESSVIEAITSDPYGFLQRHNYPIGLDEVQRCPKLMLALKQAVDEKKILGRFIITGSANLLSYPYFPESLAGRADIIHIEGLSCSEILVNEKPFALLQTAFSVKTMTEFMGKCEAYIVKQNINMLNIINEAVLYGSYPDVRLNHSLEFTQKWFKSYEMTYLERDVRDLTKYIEVIDYIKLFRVLGCRTGNLINYQNLANDCGLSIKTVKRFIELLQITFQVSLLQPWHSNLNKRLIKTPKIYLNDTGHACFVQNILDVNHLYSANNYGALIETMIFSELRKQMILLTGYQIFFYRDHAGSEVDFIVQYGQKLIAIECKGKTNVTTKDLTGIKKFMLENDTVIFGIVLYTGKQILALDNNIIAVPMAVLF